MMTPSELIGEGINPDVFRDGFCIGLLLILILGNWVMSKLINRFFPEPQPEPKTSQIQPHFLRHLLTILSGYVL